MLQVTKITRAGSMGGKTTVEVDLAMYEKRSGAEDKLLVTARGVYKRLGALRAL
jgi:hypothetical protein